MQPVSRRSGQGNATPVTRAAPLAEQVYGRMRDMLRSRAFEPGERLIDSTIARLLEVSRTPVREALMRLAADGLIETRDGGFTVPRLALSDVEEIFEIRRLLEPSAARRVAEALDPAGRAELAAALERAERSAAADDISVFADANIAFRAAWVERIPNGRMRETLHRFDDQVSLVRRTTLVDPAARAVALDGLRRLAAAFAANDGAAAAAAMAAFVDSAFGFFTRLFEEAAPTRAAERGTSEIRATQSTGELSK